MPTRGPGRPAPYVPPATITVKPPSFLIEDAQTAFKQLVIVLDVEDGTLSAENWHGGRDFHDPHLPSYYAHRDLHFVGSGHQWWTRTPRRLGWSPRHYPTYPAAQDAFQAVLDLMGRWAKELVDALEPLPDGGYDWTLRATAAYERIGYLTSYGCEPLTPCVDPADPWHGDGTSLLPDRHHYGAVSFDEVLAAAGPGWADPTWATLSDADLDLVAASMTSSWTADCPAHLRKQVGFEIKDRLRAAIVFHRTRVEGRTLAEENQGLPIHVVGARAGLRRWRATAIADTAQMPAQHAVDFLLEHPEAWPDALRATSSDREVAQLAELMEAAAAHEHRVALVNTGGLLRDGRAQLRAMIRTELAAAGDAYTHLAAELRQLGDRRAGLLHQVASFQEEPEWDTEKAEPRYAELGKAARMTRQAVRERLTAGDPDGEVLDDDVATAVRERLAGERQGLSAAHLFAVALESVGRPFPRTQLDAVLDRMARAGDLDRAGVVGATYSLARR